MNRCAGHELDLAFRELADADLGALQVGHDRDLAPLRARDLAHELRAIHVIGCVAVREIEPHDVDAGGEHAPQHLRLAACGTERGDDLGGAGHGLGSQAVGGAGAGAADRRAAQCDEGSASAAGALTRLAAALLEHLDRGQRPAFEELEERAAAG